MDNRIATAEWIDPDSIAELFPYGAGKFWLGRTIDRDAKPIGFGDDRHVLIVGGTRGGKGTTFLINNLCHWQGSAIVIDPKGENATVTAVRRGQGDNFCDGMGQSVHVLDPYRVAKIPDSYRSRFNPLDWIDGDDELCTKKAERLATSLVPFKAKAEEYWDNEARGLIGTLIVHIATSPFFRGRRTLLTLRDLIMRGDSVSCRKLEEAGEELDVSPWEFLWESMIENPACDGYTRDSGTYFSDLARDSEKQWAGVRGGVKTATDFLTSKGMRELLSASDFSISDVKKDPKGQTIYLSIPQDFIPTDCGWLRMMIDMVSTEAKLVEGQPQTGFPILMMLDEFAGLRRMDVLEKSIAQIAGYGVKMVCVIQELGQLEDVYDKNWETFINGSGVRVFFSNGDDRTKEYVSKMAGEAEITRQLENSSETEGETHSVQRGTSTNWGSSRNLGSGWSVGGNYGSNSGSNYEPGGLFTLFPSKTGGNRGGGGGLNAGYNRNKGRGTHEGGGESNSETQAYQQSKSKGVSESLHKRRLVETHDVEQKFARVDKKDDLRYPGIALVMIAGHPPMPIRKCNYYEDPAFHRCFTPHPDHPFIPLLPEELDQPFKYLGQPVPRKLVAVFKPRNELLDRLAPSAHVGGIRPWKRGEVCKVHDTLISFSYKASKYERIRHNLDALFGGMVYDFRPIATVQHGEPFLLLECRDNILEKLETRGIGKYEGSHSREFEAFPNGEEGVLWACHLNVKYRKSVVLLQVLGCMVLLILLFAVWWRQEIGSVLAAVLLLASCVLAYQFVPGRWALYRHLSDNQDNKETLQWLRECTQIIDSPSVRPSELNAFDRKLAVSKRKKYLFDSETQKWEIYDHLGFHCGSMK